MFHEIEQYVFNVCHSKIIINEESVKIMVHYNKLFQEIVEPLWRENHIKIPFPEIYIIDKEKVGGLEFVYDDRNYILVYYGTITKQREYLQKMFVKRNLEFDSSYIDKLIDYTVQFVIMHEYMHSYCGHCLSEKSEKIAQEIEADTEAIKFMVRKIIRDNQFDDIEKELVDCFIAIFYFFRSLEKQHSDEQYNIRLPQNYYEEKNRDHPLTSQRIMCIYRCFNVFLYQEDIEKSYNIKNKIINKLIMLGEKQTKNPNIDRLYALEEESIDKMQKRVEELRVKIPRIKP